MSPFEATLAELLCAPSPVAVGRALAQLQTMLSTMDNEQTSLASSALAAIGASQHVMSSRPLRETIMLMKQALIDTPRLAAAEWPPALLEAFGDEPLRSLIGAPSNTARVSALQKLYDESPALAVAPLEIVRGLLDDHGVDDSVT